MTTARREQDGEAAKHHVNGEPETPSDRALSPDSNEDIDNPGRPHPMDIILQFFESVPIGVSDIRNFARLAPLISAILAPISTLLDIPALTQHWFYVDGWGMPDPTGCVVLSAVGLAFNVVGNVLLIARFSSPHRSNRAVSLSLYCWIAKTIIAIINISYYGAYGNRRPEYTLDEGFWCGVVSVIIAGINTVCLILHYHFAYKHDDVDSKKLQLTGRKFMLSVTGLFVLIGFQGLAYNRLEGWKYFDAIYFSVQTTLTVGYGDFVPTTAWSKILLFPFAILTIAQLANQISIIINFIQDRAAERRDKWRKRYSIAMHRVALQKKPYATLIEEICLIHQIELHQQSLLQAYNLIWSFGGLITFYVVGAACFYAIEHWGYGDAVYAVVVLSTSIGLGDFSPETPGGRVFWVCYALMCVPIITNFATNTVTGIMYTITEHKFMQSGFRMARDEHPEAFAPHSHFILKNHEKWDSARVKYNEEMEKRKKGSLHKSELSTKQKQILTSLLQNPATHDAVFSVLSKEDKEWAESLRYQATTHEGHDAHESSSEVTQVGESYAKLESSEDGDTSARDNGSSGSRTTPDRSLVRTGAQTKSKLKIHTADEPEECHHHSLYDHVRECKCKQGRGSDDGDRDDLPEDYRLAFQLCKVLIDRVTHLEAQSRQMLVDSMDEDLPRTVLLADRNLQIRDTLHLYDFGINLKGNYQAEAEKSWKEAVSRHGLGDAHSAEEQDMLARVCRYRDTFAEILVLSSTLLRLQGDDLKRFERWRTGDLHHAAKVNAMTRRFRKRARRRGKKARKSTEENMSDDETDIERRLEGRARRMSPAHETDHSHPRNSDDEVREGYTLRQPRRIEAGERERDTSHDVGPQPRHGALGINPHDHKVDELETHMHPDPCGAVDTPSPSGRPSPTPHGRPGADPDPPRRPGLSPDDQPRSAHPVCSPAADRSQPKNPKSRAHKRHQRFVAIMSHSVLRAADREANQAREGWMDWLADKAYDVISDAGHAVLHPTAGSRSGGSRSGASVGRSARSASPAEERGEGGRRRHEDEEGGESGEGEGEVDDSEGELEGLRVKGGIGGMDRDRRRSGELHALTDDEDDDLGGGEDGMAARAAEKVKRRREQEERRHGGGDGEDADSEDDGRARDSRGRVRMTFAEHLTDIRTEIAERREEHKERKERERDLLDIPHVPTNPHDVPMPDGKVQPISSPTMVDAPGGEELLQPDPTKTPEPEPEGDPEAGK